MSRPPKQDKQPKEEKVLTSQEQLSSFLKEKKDDHYNFEEAKTFKVSGTSLLLDYLTKGGIGPGLHRFCGTNEGGKTSCALQYMRNFLLEVDSLEGPLKNRKGFFMKAEGRLSDEMIERSGIKFVFNAQDWVNGTCFVFESNIYETVVDAMRNLIGKNEEKNSYFFILDSVDGLIKKADLAKTSEESSKVAGGAVIAADFMKRVSIALQKKGHIAIFISQVRADIKLDPYSKEPVRQTTATGGNALLHFANWIFQFEPRFKGDLILQDPNGTYDEHKNPIVGHLAKVIVKKSPNETTNSIVKFPIKYGRKNGTSNWIEKEIIDCLVGWEIINRKGPWYSFDEEVVRLMSEAGITDVPLQIQGVAKLEALINENLKFKSFILSYIKSKLQLNDFFNTGEQEEDGQES